MPITHPFLTEEAFSIAELSALKLDGEVFTFRTGFHSIAEFPDAALRASSLQLPNRVIAERFTASWIYGARQNLTLPVQLCMNIRARTRAPRGRDVTVREVVIENSEVVSIGETLVTSPLRTILDLVCETNISSEEVAFDIQAIAKLARLSAETCLSALDRRFRVTDRTARRKLLAEILS